MNRISWVSIFALALALVRVARADTPSPDAARAYQAGQDAYDHHDYDGAIADWTRSYELSRAPGLLFNLAQAYRLRDRAGDCSQAVSDYRAFAAALPQSPQRDLANGFIRDLGTCAEPSSAPVALPVAPPSISAKLNVTAASSDPGVADRHLGLAVAGGGTALVIIGVALGHHAATLGDDVTRSCATGCDWSQLQSRDRAGRRDADIGWALDGVGIAALATGSVVYYLGFRSDHVAIEPRASGGAVSWRTWW